MIVRSKNEPKIIFDIIIGLLKDCIRLSILKKKRLILLKIMKPKNHGFKTLYQILTLLKEGQIKIFSLIIKIELSKVYSCQFKNILTKKNLLKFKPIFFKSSQKKYNLLHLKNTHLLFNYNDFVVERPIKGNVWKMSWVCVRKTSRYYIFWDKIFLLIFYEKCKKSKTDIQNLSWRSAGKNVLLYKLKLTNNWTKFYYGIIDRQIQNSGETKKNCFGLA